MILDKEIEVRWHYSNKEYYISRGYEFTKVKDPFIVAIKDLAKGANVEVNVKCDYCGRSFKKAYKTLTNGRKYIGKDSCNDCKFEKSKETNMLRYGVDSPFKLPEVKGKIEQSNLDRHGVKNVFASEEIQEKIRQTNLEKYGVENPAQNETIREKAKQTSLKRYGVEHYTQTEEYKEKAVKTSLERYGTENPAQSEMVKIKIKQASLEKYGERIPILNKEIKKKRDATNLKRYGHISPFGNEDIFNKARETLFERHGVKHPSHSKEIREKAVRTMSENGTVPTSQAQIQTYEILKELQYNVELNYPYSRCSLDIALFHENIKIDVEYDGSYWHQDSQRDRRRDEFMKSEGWKVLRVKGRRNPPTSEQLVDAVNELISTDRQFKQIYVEQDIDKMEVI